jgi:hypothetical protein
MLYTTNPYYYRLSQWWTSDVLIEEQKPSQLVVLIRGSKAEERRERGRASLEEVPLYE